MLYTVTEINGNEFTLDKQPPSTAAWLHNGIIINQVLDNNKIIVIDPHVNFSVWDFIDLPSYKALRYNEWKTRWSLVDWKSMEPMVQVLEFGAKKYEEENWKKPMDKKQILNSAMRHLIAMMNGEENDPESGLPHVGHLMCNAMFYSYHSK